MPLCDVCERCARPPILSYDGYALYNWKRFDPTGRSRSATSTPSRTSSTSTTSTGSSSSTWRSRPSLRRFSRRSSAPATASGGDRRRWPQRRAARDRADALAPRSPCCGAFPRRWTRRCTTRRFDRTSASSRESSTKAWTDTPLNFRGETGAQSSIMPTLVAFMKIPHQPSMLTDHLADMRRFMPADHRQLLSEIEGCRRLARSGRPGRLQRRPRGDGHVPRGAPRLGSASTSIAGWTIHAAPAARPSCDGSVS